MQATCTSDADCEPGMLCASYWINPQCGGTGFACQTPMDECMDDRDCSNGGTCTVEGGHRVCALGLCVIGRPFLVGREVRAAGVEARGDWRAAIAPSLDGLSAEDRATLAAHWAHVARLEHASIAAFARFALQLLALGAPPELLDATTRAQADETRHARMAFALAGAYGGSPVGPGPLALDGALETSSLRDVLRLVVLEGCIGETVAAVEAAECRERATDPAVRSVLTDVAADETRHAELAFRFVQWALAASGGARTDVAREILGMVEGEVAALPSVPSLLDEERLEAHGVPSPALRNELRRRALAEVIRPCVAALCAAPPGHERSVERHVHDAVRVG